MPNTIIGSLPPLRRPCASNMAARVPLTRMAKKGTTTAFPTTRMIAAVMIVVETIVVARTAVVMTAVVMTAVAMIGTVMIAARMITIPARSLSPSSSRTLMSSAVIGKIVGRNVVKTAVRIVVKIGVQSAVIVTIADFHRVAIVPSEANGRTVVNARIVATVRPVATVVSAFSVRRWISARRSRHVAIPATIPISLPVVRMSSAAPSRLAVKNRAGKSRGSSRSRVWKRSRG
jgi:hypothetical protein